MKITPFRVLYERGPLHEHRNHLLDFLKKTRHILGYIKNKKGNLLYVMDVLGLVKDEELCQPLRETGREIPYVWELHSKRMRPVLFSEMQIAIKRACKNNRFEEIDIQEVPKPVFEVFETLKDNPPDVKWTVPVSGKLILTYNLRIPYGQEYYLLEASETVLLDELLAKKEVKKSRGRRGEPQSDVAMYLLYLYFRKIGIKGIYEKIAMLVNNFSTRFFCPPQGAPLNPENVRKRIQWVKKKDFLVEFATGYQQKWCNKYYIPCEW